MVPVAPAQPAQTRGPGRGEQIGDIRLRLQREVIASFTDLIDAKPEEVTAKIEGIVDRVITEGDLAVTREERQRLVDQMLHDVTGFGPIEPFLKDGPASSSGSTRRSSTTSTSTRSSTGSSPRWVAASTR